MSETYSVTSTNTGDGHSAGLPGPDSQADRAAVAVPSVSQQIALMRAEAERLVDTLAMAANVAKVLEGWDATGAVQHRGSEEGEGGNGSAIGGTHDRLFASVASSVANVQRLQRIALQQLLQSSFDVTRHLHKATALAMRVSGMSSEELPEEPNLAKTVVPEADGNGTAEPRGLVVHLRPWMEDGQGGRNGEANLAAPAAPSAAQRHVLDGWARAVATHYTGLLFN